jgi:hypothetical protein
MYYHGIQSENAGIDYVIIRQNSHITLYSKITILNIRDFLKENGFKFSSQKNRSFHPTGYENFSKKVLQTT